MRAVIVFIVAAMLMGTGAARAEAPKRVALVIGNATYQSLMPLGNPRLDAERLATLLDANGFDVVRCDGRHPGCFDLDRDGLEDALEAFRKKADGADLALAFYAGHGMEGRDGNVLAPVDMEISDCAERTLRKAVALEALFKAMAGAHSKMVILDACRNDPLARCPVRGSRAMSFAPLTVPESESYLLVSSTKPGQFALDGPTGAHSPYARALLQWLEKAPEVNFQDVLSYVAKEVIEDTARTNTTQVPEMLQRGMAPAGCLKGEGCVGDVRAAALTRDVEDLRQQHARDQELAAIARDYLAAAEKDRRPLSEEEKRQELQKLKQVSDFMLEAERGRGRPFSNEERAQELQRLVEAGRALVALKDTRGERALERLNAGDETEAKRLFSEAAAAHKQAAQTAASRTAEENQEAAKALRHLAAIVKPKNVAEAADNYKEATRLDPADAQTWIDYGRAARDAGRTAEAKVAFEQADLKARESNDLLVRHRAALGLGDVALDEDNGSAEERHYSAALALAEEYAKSDPSNVAAQRGQAVAHDRIGRVLYINSAYRVGNNMRSNLAAAIEHFKTSLAVLERLVGADADNQELQKDLAAEHFLVGSVLERQDDHAGALASYQAALNIAEPHAKDPDNSDWLKAVATFHGAISSVQEEQGNFDGAFASRRAALDFAERVARIDPTNTRWQLELEFEHRGMGALLEMHGDHAGALASYQAARAVAEHLTSINPGNVTFQGRLAHVHSLTGQTLFAQDDLAGALASYQQALAIHDSRAASDPANSEFQTDRAFVHWLIGGALKARHDLPGALASYQAAIAGYEKGDPSKGLWQRGLSLVHRAVGRILEEQGDPVRALASYRASQSVAERLVRIDPTDDHSQDTLALTHRFIGSLLQKQGNLAEALASYRAALAMDEERLKAKAGDAGRQRQVAYDHSNVGDVLLKRGDLSGALSSYRAALAGYGKLDPDTVATLESLRSAHYNIGHVLRLRGDLAGALASFQAGLVINEHLASVDSGNSDRQRAVWGSHDLIGDVLQDQGRLADALAHYAAAQDIGERRSKADPASPQWQRFLATSYGRVAGVKLAMGDRASALALWRKALAVVEASAAAIEQEEIKSAGKLGEKATEALLSVEWHALFAREPSKALAAWERAHAFVPELNASHEINRAHAFLFLNRQREARALYLENKGKPNGTALKQTIADDFRALRRAGLTHPMMHEVEVALGVAPTQASRSAAATAHR